MVSSRNRIERPSSNEEDCAAMAALANGDDDGLNQLIDRWQAPITAYLYRMVGDYESALDLSQEVFVRLYRNRANFKEGRSFSSYIFTIATNLGKNHFRWKGRHPETGLDPEWGSNISGEGVDHVSPAGFLEKSEESKKVKEAVSALPEKLRIPLILYYYQDLPQSEIAAILKCSEKSIETRLYRARKLLKASLSK